MADTALVLGGGGVAGVAWELGVLAGLAHAGVDVTDAEVVIGTSAGSVVATLVANGVDVQERYEAQASADPAAAPAELSVDIDGPALFAQFQQAAAEAMSQQDARARVGALALAASTVPESARREVIAGRLSGAEWPDRELLLTVVDTATGESAVFTRDSSVDLVDVVAASCAVPGVWPPVTIAGRRYMDGGMVSMTNARLAEGSERVLVLAPMIGFEQNPFGPTLAEEVDDLERGGLVLVLSADEESTDAFGTNALDPATRAPSARAGFRQGVAAADEVRALWAP